MERKQFKAVDSKVDEAGHVKFRFAQLNVLDHGNDIIFPGAFEEGKQVAISAWNHSSWGNVPAVGKGTISSDGQWATFEGDFFLNTEAGKENYQTVKAMGDLQEYSFGFDTAEAKAITACRKCMKMIADHDVADATCPSCNGKGTSARGLVKLLTYEASPVLKGQGIDTGTDSIKAAGFDLETKGAIAYHDYGKADEGTAWDGPAQIKAADVATLKKICAWYDDSAPDSKSSYKLPHHEADGLKAVWKGVRAAMGALMGARGGAKIPDADRKAVYNHLAKHYKEFDKEPPSFDALETGELKFADHAACVLAGAQGFLERARAVSDLRAEKGRELGTSAKALLQEMAEEFGVVVDELKRLISEENANAETAALVAQLTVQMQEIERVLT